MISPARALLPLAVVPALIASVSTAAGESYALGLLAGLVGITGLYLTINDATGNSVAVPLGYKAENNAPLPVAPATVTAPTSRKYMGLGGMYSYNSAQEACTSTMPEHQTCQCDAATGNCLLFAFGVQYGSMLMQSMETSVPPAGYECNGSDCNLVNPRQAKDDKRCDILLSNGQFATASDVNCPSTTDGSKLAPLIRDGKVIAYGTNSSGQPLIFTVSPAVTVNNRDWIQVQIDEQVQTQTQTQVKTTTVTVDPQTGTITGVETSTKPGSISSPSADTVPTTQPSTTDPTNTPTVNTRPGETVQPEINIDTCGLPGKPACAVDDTGFTNAPKPWESVDKPDFEDPKKSVLDNYVEPSFEWSQLRPSLFPGQAVACTPIEFRGKIDTGPAGGLDATTTFDPCWMFEIVRVFLGYLFFLSTAIYLWRTFMGAEGGLKRKY